MDDAAVLLWAALQVPGLGAGHLRAMRDAYGSVAAAIEGAAAAGVVPPGVPAELFRRLPLALDLPAAARRMRQVRAAGVEPVCWDDARYPLPLWLAPEAPPALLYLRGRLPVTFRAPAARVRAAAVVGTRRATPRGLALARELSAALAELRVVVVSGLAIGIDGAAHEGALEGARGWDGATVAVLGGGHGHLHPARHQGLAARILATGGGLLSEYPPDVRPETHTFPERNRIISGLSRVVVVVEAGVRSGANITAGHAVGQHRDVFACPGRPGDPSVAGTLNLIQDGAHPVTELEDVLYRFRAEPGDPAYRRRRGAAEAGSGGSEAELSEAEASEPASAPAVAGSGAVGSRSETDDDPILGALYRVDEAALDDLVPALGMRVPQLLARLTHLELRGAVRRTGTGNYRLSPGVRERRAGRDRREAARHELAESSREEAGALHGADPADARD